MKLVDAIEVLAYKSEKQIAFLKNLGTYPSLDELALQFDDGYLAFRNSADVVKELREKLEQIDAIFDHMSDSPDKSLWEASSLDRDGWNDIRNLAEEVLEIWNQTQRPNQFS